MGQVSQLPFERAGQAEQAGVSFDDRGRPGEAVAGKQGGEDAIACSVGTRAALPVRQGSTARIVEREIGAIASATAFSNCSLLRFSSLPAPTACRQRC